MDLQMELTRRRIPYEVRSGMRFFEQAHIKDMTSYLRAVLNPMDEISWTRKRFRPEDLGCGKNI